MKYSTPRASPRRENGNGSFVAFVAAREGSERRDGVSFVTRRRSSGFERAKSPTTPTRSSSTSSPPPPRAHRCNTTPRASKRNSHDKSRPSPYLYITPRAFASSSRASRLSLLRRLHGRHAFHVPGHRRRETIIVSPRAHRHLRARVSASSLVVRSRVPTAVILALDRRPYLASPSRVSSTSRVAHPLASRIVRTHSLY